MLVAMLEFMLHADLCLNQFHCRYYTPHDPVRKYQMVVVVIPSPYIGYIRSYVINRLL
jgi:hypothetical protein